MVKLTPAEERTVDGGIRLLRTQSMGARLDQAW